MIAWSKHLVFQLALLLVAYFNCYGQVKKPTYVIGATFSGSSYNVGENCGFGSCINRNNYQLEYSRLFTGGAGIYMERISRSGVTTCLEVTKQLKNPILYILDIPTWVYFPSFNTYFASIHLGYRASMFYPISFGLLAGVSADLYSPAGIGYEKRVYKDHYEVIYGNRRSANVYYLSVRGEMGYVVNDRMAVSIALSTTGVITPAGGGSTLSKDVAIYENGNLKFRTSHSFDRFPIYVQFGIRWKLNNNTSDSNNPSNSF